MVRLAARSTRLATFCSPPIIGGYQPYVPAKPGCGRELIDEESRGDWVSLLVVVISVPPDFQSIAGFGQLRGSVGDGIGLLSEHA